MKLNDFIKQDPIPKKSGYKVVMGDSPKEQELAKEASRVTALENSLSELQEKYDKVTEENEFFKGQVKRTQHEIDEAKDKVFNQENLQLELVQKENQFTLIQEELHEITIKEQKNSETIKQLKIDLNNKTGELERLENEHSNLTKDSELITSKYNGLQSDFSKAETFSEKIENDYNKIRERNTVLLQEREDLSRLKSEFEAKSIRLGEELTKAQENIRILKDKLENLNSKDTVRDKETIASNNLHTKLRADLKKVKLNKSKPESFDELYTKVNNFLDNKNQIKIDRETKERLQAMEWNVAKQELKLGNASTYPNKLGFGASTFFKLNNEENINYG